MSEPIDPRGGEIEVSPEEERFLKRFFRRQLLPYLALLAVMWVAALWWSGGGGASEEVRSQAAELASLRAENERLQEGLSGLTGRLDARLASDEGANDLEDRVEDAKRSVRMIESRVSAALERRIDELEGRISAGGSTQRVAAGPPPEAAAWDVSAILDRLYALEMRGGSGGGASAERLAQLERRIQHLEQGVISVPASPTP